MFPFPAGALGVYLGRLGRHGWSECHEVGDAEAVSPLVGRSDDERRRRPGRRRRCGPEVRAAAAPPACASAWPSDRSTPRQTASPTLLDLWVRRTPPWASCLI